MAILMAPHFCQRGAASFYFHCIISILTRTCPSNCPGHLKEDSDRPSPPSWIHEDLHPWAHTGITRDMVESAKWTTNLRNYSVHRAHRRCFGYCGDDDTLDIVFLDWSFWGWAEINIKPWKSLLKDLKEGNKRMRWMDREPYAYWKGNPTVALIRQQLIKCNVSDNQDWNACVYAQDWIRESQEGYKQSDLASQCIHRYKIYIEGSAWSVSEKYILACDSVSLLVKPHYYDFFTRGLMPVHHYWPIRNDDKCKSIKFAVDWGNSHKQKWTAVKRAEERKTCKRQESDRRGHRFGAGLGGSDAFAQGIGKAASDFIQEELKMEYVYDYMFHLLNEYAKLLTFKPIRPRKAIELCAETMACQAEGLQKKFFMESLENGPSYTSPCTMPNPYDPPSLHAILKRKENSIKQVELWEKNFWDNQNKQT
uniref:Glycosyl transferase CAP10 domain-containing protein n=1 Tax=Fagus sylvatica TaxID=28930 RepID=A0A2N9EZ21_FAGSY